MHTPEIAEFHPRLRLKWSGLPGGSWPEHNLTYEYQQCGTNETTPKDTQGLLRHMIRDDTVTHGLNVVDNFST